MPEMGTRFVNKQMTQAAERQIYLHLFCWQRNLHYNVVSKQLTSRVAERQIYCIYIYFISRQACTTMQGIMRLLKLKSFIAKCKNAKIQLQE
jgi:hypothetical protein